MKIYGYVENEEGPDGTLAPNKLAEITLVANPSELRLIAQFIESCASGMEERGTSWEHEHLSDKHKQFAESPHFVVFNPEAPL